MNNKQVKNNGMKKILFGRVFILSCILALCSATSMFADTIDVYIDNRVFTGNATSGTLTFDVFIKPGQGYTLPNDAQWTAMNLRIDIYGQPGITYTIPGAGTLTTHDFPGTHNMQTLTYGHYATLADAPPGVIGTVAINAGRTGLGTDLPSTFTRIGTISIGTSGGLVTDETLLFTRHFVPYGARAAFWSNSAVRRPFNQWFDATAAMIAINDTTICYNTPASLKPSTKPHTSRMDSISNPVFRWYSAPTGGTLLHTGLTYSPPTNLTATTTYYVSVSGASHFESIDRKPVTITVLQALTAGSIGASQIIPHNTAPAPLTGGTPGGGGGGTGSYSWQSSADASTWTDIAGTGTGYAPGVLTTTTHYRRGFTNDCGTVYTTHVTITVGAACTPATAANITAVGVIICAGETASLSATSVVPSPTFRWYSSQTSTTVLETGPTYTTPALSATTSYFVSVEGTGYCENATGTRKEVIVTVNPRTTPDMIKITVN